MFSALSNRVPLAHVTIKYFKYMGHQGNQVAGTREVHKMHVLSETLCSPSTHSFELLGLGRGQNAQLIWVCDHVEHLRT